MKVLFVSLLALLLFISGVQGKPFKYDYNYEYDYDTVYDATFMVKQENSSIGRTSRSFTEFFEIVKKDYRDTFDKCVKRADSYGGGYYCYLNSVMSRIPVAHRNGNIWKVNGVSRNWHLDIKSEKHHFKREIVGVKEKHFFDFKEGIPHGGYKLKTFWSCKNGYGDTMVSHSRKAGPV